MSNIFPIDFEEKLTMAQDDYILFSDSEDGNKIKKAQYKNLKGEQGNPWQDWAAATITVGSTTTGTPWSSASVTNSWTSSAAVLDFTIPQWAKWETWAWATVAIWTTTTLPAGSSATVTNSWTSTNAVLNFWIPKWDSWSGSWDVNWPASSTDGDVAIFDWATGKLIKDGSVALSTLSSAASLASSAIQPWDDISDLNNDSGFITGIDSTDVTTALGYTPYDASNPSGYTTNTWDVVWPASSTDWHLAVFDWATWKLIKDGGSVPTWVPSWGTDGQVLSKVSWNIAWANPSGWWDVVVSSQTGNILTTGMKIRCGTEWDYANLGTYDSNSLYLTVPWGATPWWWQPWADTIVYYPFDTDWNDYSWNGYNFTTTNSTQITTVGWVTCLDMNGSTCSVSSIDVLTTYTDYTWLTWIYVSSGSIDWAFGDNGQGWWWSWFRVWQFKQVRWGNPVNTYSTFSSFSSNQWVLFWIVMDNWEWSIYQNWVKTVLLWSGWLAPYNNITPFSFSGKDGVWAYGYISNFIIEKRAWTYQEIQDYFDQTKSTYWIS